MPDKKFNLKVFFFAIVVLTIIYWGVFSHFNELSLIFFGLFLVIFIVYVLLNFNKFYTTKNQPGPCVIIIDSFSGECDMDYDRDGKVDKIHHGEVVKSFIKSKNVKCLDPGNKSENIPLFLKKIRMKVGANIEKVLAINISLGYLISYEDLSLLSSIKLTPENLEKSLPELIETLRKIIDNENSHFQKKTFCKFIVDTHDEIENLADLGVPVIIAAGNVTMNDSYINLLCLNKRAITVGGTSKYATTYETFLEKIPLTDLHARGAFNNLIIDEKILYKLTSVQEYLKTNPGATPEEIRQNVNISICGTSYTTPFILNYAVKMVEKGFTVDKINEAFSEAYKLSIELNRPVEEILDDLPG